MRYPCSCTCLDVKVFDLYIVGLWEWDMESCLYLDRALGVLQNGGCRGIMCVDYGEIENTRLFLILEKLGAIIFKPPKWLSSWHALRGFGSAVIYGMRPLRWML